MKTYKTSFLKALIMICVAIAIICLLSIAIAYTIGFLQSSDYKWRDKTTPLDNGTKLSLCRILNINIDNPLCNKDQETYADQFFPIIEDKFPVKDTTYNQINEKLGIYQVRRESVSKDSNGNKYYRVWYDLRGDGVTAIVYYFWEKDNTAFRIGTHLGEGD